MHNQNRQESNKKDLGTTDRHISYHILQGGETVGKIEFITRIQVNGVKEEVSGAKASEIIRERVENALQAMNYEKRAAG